MSFHSYAWAAKNICTRTRCAMCLQRKKSVGYVLRLFDERRYRQSGLSLTGRRTCWLVQLLATAFSSHEPTASDLNSTPRLSGNIGVTWRTAERLRHNDHKIVYYNAECAQRSGSSSQTRSTISTTTSPKTYKRRLVVCSRLFVRMLLTCFTVSLYETAVQT